jgi:hypothetical protein
LPEACTNLGRIGEGNKEDIFFPLTEIFILGIVPTVPYSGSYLDTVVPGGSVAGRDVESAGLS